MEHSSRHLRFKLQSLGRRLDDLEEATRNLQKAEDEVLDLQDKIIQAEGSNSSMLADVEALRKRVLKIEGKDEEVKKAEDLCRLIKEKLENEEHVTRELRLEIEQLQKRMSELEKLEEAFSKSKSDCTQLCLSLNEEKNMSKKLSSELELFRTRIKELESSESKLDKAEQLMTSELEKIKLLTVSFANERKRFIEREKQHEKTILELTEQLEVKGKITAGDQTRNESNLLERSTDQHGERSFRIEDTLTSKPLERVGFDYVKQSESQTSSKNDKNKPQEDNKIKELNLEIEKLKNQLKRFEGLEQELKQLKDKNCELQENLFSEQSKNKQATDEVQALKRQASQSREVENGVLDSDEMLHSRIKNERTKNKSTEPPISKYTSREESPQYSRSERSRNSETTYKRQFSNSSSNSRKSPRPAMADATVGNLRKLEDRVPTSSYRDLSHTQNDFKKSKDQPSVLSRYPPAIQEQLPQKSWKTSTGKQTERPIKLFGEDYSSKAYLTTSFSAATSFFKERPSEDSSENGATPNLHDEIIPSENCTVSSELTLETVNHSPNFTNDLECNSKLETNDLRPTGRDRLSKYSRSSNRDDTISNSYERSSKSQTSSKDEGELQNNQATDTQRSYIRDRRSKSSKPLIPEKPHILENSDYRETERRARLSGLYTKRQPSSQEENHSKILQRELATDPLRRASSDGLGSADTSSYASTRTRSCSPRESLQCTMVIKPIIIEKDMKESMSEYRARSSSETSRFQVNTTPNKVTSSITIYPSETVSTHATMDEATKERHTSTSNIRLSANDQPVLKNDIIVPFEISLSKEDGVLKVENTDKTLDQNEMSNDTDQSIVNVQTKGINDELVKGTWKSIDVLEANHLDSKRGSRSSWRKGLSGSTEELDRLDRDLTEAKSRRKSCFDEDKPARLRNYELYARNKSSSVSSWSTTPEFISKRSQSNLTAKEIVSRKNVSNDLSYTSLNRSSLDIEDALSSRRKYTSDRLGRTDATGWRQTQNQSHRHKSMVEERIRQLEH
ncbi:leucine zipper protein 1 [Gastrophryne carolinensis]